MAPHDDTANPDKASKASKPPKPAGNLLTPEETLEPSSSVICGRPTPPESPSPPPPEPSASGPLEPSAPRLAIPYVPSGRGLRAFDGINPTDIIDPDRYTRRNAHIAIQMPASAFHAAFYVGISKPLYRNHLPSKPRTYKDLKGHLFERQFRDAIQVEIQALERHGT